MTVLARKEEISESEDLAGVEGFEPPYGGIKTRCLTAWRHPSVWSKSIYLILASISRIGDSFSPRATKLRHRSGARAAMRSASIALSQGAKIQEPVPVSRAFAN